MDPRYADLKPEPVTSPVPPPARTQEPAARRTWVVTESRKNRQRETPLSQITADKAAVMRSTGRLTYSAGWRDEKAITFDAAI